MTLFDVKTSHLVITIALETVSVKVCGRCNLLVWRIKRDIYLRPVFDDLQEAD
jgi:hypothetical protein